MNEKKIAKILTKKLLAMGFIVHRYNSITTNSIYLKLDFGVCCGIRIADHNGKKKYHYRFNVVKDYSGDKIIYYKNLIPYSFLIAASGLSFIARFAGKYPASTPTSTDKKRTRNKN